MGWISELGLCDKIWAGEEFCWCQHAPGHEPCSIRCGVGLVGGAKNETGCKTDSLQLGPQRPLIRPAMMSRTRTAAIQG